MKKIIILIIIILISPLMTCAGEKINVAFCISNNYTLYTMLAINSILINNKSNSDYTFYIIENDINEHNKQKITHFVEKRKQKIVFVNWDTSSVDKDKSLSAKSFWHHLMSARLLLPNLLPEDIKKIIYLDSDILVISDLKELYDTNIENYAVAMVYDINQDIHLKFDNRLYYNAGVMLMNLDYWRRNNVTSRMKDFIDNNTSLLFPDQDLINIILGENIKEVNKKWNNQFTPRLYSKGKPIIMSDKYDEGIIHLLSFIKPWHVFPSSHYKAHKLYYKYWNQSELWIYQPIHFFKIYKNIYNDLCEFGKAEYFFRKPV